MPAPALPGEVRGAPSTATGPIRVWLTAAAPAALRSLPVGLQDSGLRLARSGPAASPSLFQAPITSHHCHSGEPAPSADIDGPRRERVQPARSPSAALRAKRTAKQSSGHPRRIDWKGYPLVSSCAIVRESPDVATRDARACGPRAFGSKLSGTHLISLRREAAAPAALATS